MTTNKQDDLGLIKLACEFHKMPKKKPNKHFEEQDNSENTTFKKYYPKGGTTLPSCDWTEGFLGHFKEFQGLKDDIRNRI